MDVKGIARYVCYYYFISSDWEAKHVTIGLFEVMDTSGAIMVPKLQKFLDRFSLTQKIVAYVNMKGANCTLVQVP
jgi:hypothetical protein